MPDVFVGLGSNVEPEHGLRRAIAELERRFGALRRSAAYRSPALGFAGRDFLNLVVAFRSDLGPDGVKEILAAIETAAGRSRSDPQSGRCELDLDLLLYGRRVDPGRRLPRDDILGRAFVLAPLAELAPQLGHPVTGEAIGAAWLAMAATRPELTKLRDLRQ